MTERECGYWINNIKGVGLTSINRLYDYFGNAKNIFLGKDEDFEKIKNLTPKKILDIKNSRNVDKIKKNMEVIKSKGIDFVLRNEENYPKKLEEIYNPPRILYYRGKLPSETKPTIAIVGARNCTSYGSVVARKFARELATYGVQIVSGMARGIDAYAHKGALDCETGKTFGILGCGIDTCYPPENIDIFMRTVNSGGIISEYPMNTIAKAGNFPMRNRIISGLCDAILVVEAKKKSGSLISVDLALEQGKEIYVIPGRLDDPLSEGCNNLIKMGAKIITSVGEILEDFGYAKNGVFASEYEIKEDLKFCEQEKDYKNLLASDEKIVYACLRLEQKHINEILCETQLGISEVIRILFSLEEKGLVVQTMNNYYARLN